MSITDLVSPTPAIIPAVEAKEYPLKYARLIHLQGTPRAMRAYVELQPYRRILDAEGNIIGEELKTPEVQGDIVVIDTPNILPTQQTAESKALVENTLLQFIQAGGDLKALVMAGIVVVINQVGIQTGVLKDPNPPAPTPEPTPEPTPDPYPIVPPVEPVEPPADPVEPPVDPVEPPVEP